jgi:two-component system chemotaxis response regulator CheB
MVSSLTTEGADSTLKALELGAVDFIPKELSYINVNIIKIKEDLIRKVTEIVRHKRSTDRLKRLQNLSGSKQPIRSLYSKIIPEMDYKALAIGISTGGPLSLQKVIPALSVNINIPVFIVQHMPPRFTKSLADRLNNLSILTVKEAEDGEEVKNGRVYIAPGGSHMILKSNPGKGVVIQISSTPSDTLHKPSVDVMMNSVMEVYGRKTLGLIMTGMGKDGCEAMKRLKNLNGTCLAQDEASSVVYGMPKAVVDAGIADAVLPLEEIANKLNMVLSNERVLLRAGI